MTSHGRVAFTKLVVDDIEASANFYEQLLGIRQLARLQANIGDTPIDEIMLGDDDGIALILLTWLDGRQVRHGDVILGVTTLQIDEFFTHAGELGATVVSLPSLSEHGGGVLVGFMRDPEGHLLEVVFQP